MFGPKKTRAELSESLGIQGKPLTAFLCQEVGGGRMIRRMVFKDPVLGVWRHLVYQTVPQNLELDLHTQENPHVVP